MNRLGLIKTACTALAALMLAACTQDEGMDGNGSLLPEGKYPLEIAGVTVTAASGSEPWDASPGHAPQTRVAENANGNSSKWTNGDEIGVKIGETGAAGAYTVNVDGSGTVTGLTAKTPVYWASTTGATVSAWYPAADGTLVLSNQSNNGLAYAMTGTGSGDYKKGVSLTFTHSLAKVRVVFSDKSTADLTGATVSVKSYPSCTSTKGAVTGIGTQEYIPMKEVTYDNKTCYEANLVPGTLSTDAFQIKVGDKTATCSTSEVALTKGQLHIITLTIIKTIDISSGGIEITNNGTYAVTGTGTNSIKINGNPTVILSGVTINAEKPIDITGGTPTIKIKEGTSNTLTSTGKGAGISLKGQNVNVKIIGNGITDDAGSLTVKGGEDSNQDCSGGIGLSYGDTQCGNITIENITLEVTGAYGGAAIGSYSSSRYSQSCGKIEITNSKITAKPGRGAAAIGFGMVYGSNNYTMGAITITNSDIVATLIPDYSGSSLAYPAIIGGCANIGGTITLGDIRIKTSDSSTTPQEYFEGSTCGNVLVGVPASAASYTINNFKIYWNDDEKEIREYNGVVTILK